MIISHLSCSFSCCSAIAKLQSLSLHDALPIYSEVQSQHVASSVSTIDIERVRSGPVAKLQEVFKGTLPGVNLDRKSTRLNSSHVAISYAGFCSEKKVR